MKKGRRTKKDVGKDIGKHKKGNKEEKGKMEGNHEIKGKEKVLRGLVAAFFSF